MIPESLEKHRVLNNGRWAHINVKLHFFYTRRCITTIPFPFSEADIRADVFLSKFLQFLLCQRKKIALDFLMEQLPFGVKEGWQTVLSLLEGTNRRLIDVNQGAVVFTLYCPNDEAKEIPTLQTEDTRVAFYQLMGTLGRTIQNFGYDCY